MLKCNTNTFIQGIHDAHEHDIRKIYCIVVGLVCILCKISLQFYSRFIDDHRSSICTILDTSKLIKLPTSIIFSLHFGLNLAGYKSKKLPSYKEKNEKEKLIQIVGSSAFLTSCIIEIFFQIKIIHFLSKNNKDIMSYTSLVSSVLFLLSESINCYYIWKKYLDNKGSERSTKYGKEAIFTTFTLSLGLLSSILKRMRIPAIPIDLGSGITYNFNFTVTISLILSITYLASNIDKFINQPSNGTDPHTELNGAQHSHHYSSGTTIVVD